MQRIWCGGTGFTWYLRAQWSDSPEREGISQREGEEVRSWGSRSRHGRRSAGRLHLRRGDRTLACGRNVLYAGPLACGWSAHACPDLRRVHVELGQGSTEGIAVHAKLFCGFALIALVMSENFEQVASFELTKSLSVGDTGAMHLSDEAVQFTLQRSTSLALSGLLSLEGTRALFSLAHDGLIQRGPVCLPSCDVPDAGDAARNPPLEVWRYNEAYLTRGGKEIGCEARVCN